MAARASKKKLPPREEKQFKAELSKTSGKVLDDHTLEILFSLLNAGVFKTLDYPIAQGKEAMVFRATCVDKDSGETFYRAVKIFKYETSSFYKSMHKYIEGDPRFKIRGTHRALVNMWSRKEFANLKICFEAGVRVPEPVICRENVVVMEFLGEGGIPSALLEHVVVDEPAQMLDKLLEDVRKMYRARLIHADLSSFNIIVHKGEPYIIDLGQAVLKVHPRAQDFLEHDVRELVKFFAKLGVEKTFEEAMAFVLKQE